jgi:hypothetical protein
MTLTINIRPEMQAELARHAAAQGRAIEAVAAVLLENALAQRARPEGQTGQSLVDAFADIRGLLSDEEVDRISSRNVSPGRSVDLS